MRNQAPAVAGRGRVRAGAKDDVVSQRVRAGLDRLCTAGRITVGMNAHLAEVEAETRLEVAAYFAGERLALPPGFDVRRSGCPVGRGPGRPHGRALLLKGVGHGL